MDEDANVEYEVWVQDLKDRNVFANRKMGLKLPESALEERPNPVLKIAYDGERASTLPPGYAWNTEGQIVIDQASADIVCQVFELHARGLSAEKIARKLDDPNSTGRAVWHAWNIREILDNEETYHSGLLKSDSSLHLPPILK